MTPSYYFIIEGHHCFIFNLDHREYSGTAIFIHARHADNAKAFIRIHDRLLAINLRFSSCVFGIAFASMPYAGYAFDELHSVYDKLYSLFHYVMQKLFVLIVGGDFNIVVNLSPRGDLLNELMDIFDLQIANSQESIGDELQWIF